jgi:hypothetical protein
MSGNLPEARAESNHTVNARTSAANNSIYVYCVLFVLENVRVFVLLAHSVAPVLGGIPAPLSCARLSPSGREALRPSLTERICRHDPAWCADACRPGCAERAARGQACCVHRVFHEHLGGASLQATTAAMNSPQHTALIGADLPLRGPLKPAVIALPPPCRERISWNMSRRSIFGCLGCTGASQPLHSWAGWTTWMGRVLWPGCSHASTQPTAALARARATTATCLQRRARFRCMR